MATMYAVEAEAEIRQAMSDLCPICGASGGELCVEEDGQLVLDHWGRPEGSLASEGSAESAAAA
jgi:hypothetical protein